MEQETDVEEGIVLLENQAMEHHIDIKDEVNRAHPKIWHDIDEKIHHLPPLHPEACIFRVHPGLRQVNVKAYTPIVVSIGPYHHGNPKLHAMEEHKLRYLHSVLERNCEKNAKRYLLFMEQLEDRTRGFYAEPICLKRGKFLEMMLLDACFIIEFLCKYDSKKLRQKDDPIFRSFWMDGQILRDMMLLENQLPFFVISELFSIINKIPLSEATSSFMKLALLTIHNMMPRFYNRPLIHLKNKSTFESKHFLDLVHNVCRPSSRQVSSPIMSTRMPSLTELKEAGVHFKAIRSTDLSLFDIKFKNGHLEIPTFKVDDSTDTFFRNIIAYEQHSSEVTPKHFTDYTIFLDYLINTENDVNELRICGILENNLGSDEIVSCMFNKMCDGIFHESSTYYYSQECQKLNKHCVKGWNKAMAKLRHNYFNNPWASISTVAATILLFLTLIQTLGSVNLISPFK